jgi:hypothetical protein
MPRHRCEIIEALPDLLEDVFGPFGGNLNGKTFLDLSSCRP